MAAVITVGGLGLAGAGSPATAAVSGPIDCPTALPTDQAVDGLTGTGYTVDKGTTPVAFTARVLGRLKDGIAPGVDMIMAELDSQAIADAGGIWSGISGSPVYTAEGKLIGSVSYGLASASNIAGLTPGADIMKVYSAKSVPADAAKKVAVSKATATKIAAAGSVSTAEASKGFSELKLPFTISGLKGSHNAKQLKKLSKKLGSPVMAGGATASGTKAAVSTIGAGSNFAAAFSYGDITFGGVGTTTTVCNGVAVAFGHPLDLRGKTQFSAHSAEAVYIQRDDVFGAFKAANIGGVVGVGDRDRMTGIRATLGATPTVYPISSSFSLDGDTPVVNRTTGVFQGYAPDIAFAHVATALDNLDGYWEGSGNATTTVTGTRAGGKPFSVTVADRYASNFALDWEMAGPVASIVGALQSQPYEPVKITGVDVQGEVTQTYKQWRVNNVRVWKKGAWAKGLSISTSAGKTVKLRVSLSKYQSEAVKYVYLNVKVPADASGTTGILSVTGGSGGGEGEFSSFSASGVRSAAAGAKFDALLKDLGTPVNSAVSATLDLSPVVKKPVVTTKQANAAVAGYGKEYTVTVS